MGLSNEERFERIAWGIMRMSRLGRQLSKLDAYDQHGDIEHLVGLIDNLWPAFLNSKSNGTYWIIGGDSDNQITSTDSLWASAVTYHCEEACREDPWEAGELPFNPLRGFLDIEGLLNNLGHDSCLRLVFLIQRETENLVYALRRYDDEFLTSLSDLSNLVSRVQGTCFAIFGNSSEISVAYLANEIFTLMYRNEVFKEIALQQHWHHNLSRIMEVSVEDVMKWHKRIYTKRLSTASLIVMALQIMGRNYHYDHQLQELCDYLDKHDVSTVGVKRVFPRNVRAHDKREKESRECYRKDKDDGHLFAIHGFFE